MICRKCANIFDDSFSVCPCCGWITNGEEQNTPVKKAEPFRVNINYDNEFTSEVQPSQVQSNMPPVSHRPSFDGIRPDSQSAAKRTTPPVRPVSLDRISPDGIKPAVQAEPVRKTVPTNAAPRVRKLDAGSNTVKRPVQKGGQKAEYVQYPTVRNSEPEVKQVVEAEGFYDKDIKIRNKASNIIVIMVCVLSLVMGGLTLVSAKTDVFSKKSDTVKTTPLTGLSSEDSGSLEKQLSTMGLSSGFVFDSSKMTPNEFLKFIKPYDKSGLYSRFYTRSTKITAQADPADRFGVQTENEGYYYSESADSYAYYKISAEEIDRILSVFGMTQAHTANDEDYYYSKGYYYFAHKDEISTATDDIIDVASSNRIEDGSYYVQCSRLGSQTGATLESSYLIVEKGDDGQMPWIIRKVSAEPVFDSDGNLSGGEGAISFTMKTTTVQATAKDGTVYCNYSVSYPEFGNGSLGEQTAGRIFTDVMNSINLSCENVQKDYENYIACGGDKNALPFESETVCFVSYNKDGYIGVVRETADNLPDLEKMKEEYAETQEHSYYTEEETEEETVVMPKRYFEAYLIEKDTGDFVNKDNVIGKDYQKAYELAYRIYNGYDYKEVADSLATTQAETSELISYGETTDTYQETTSSYYTDETTEAYIQVPEDSDELGKKIYESASTLCDDGYLFCFVSEEGYFTRVVIPFSVEDLFVIEKTS